MGIDITTGPGARSPGVPSSSASGQQRESEGGDSAGETRADSAASTGQILAGQFTSSAMMLQTGMQFGSSVGEAGTAGTVASQGQVDIAKI